MRPALNAGGDWGSEKGAEGQDESRLSSLRV